MKYNLLLIILFSLCLIVLNYFSVNTQPLLLDEKVKEVKENVYPIRSIDIQDTNYNDLSFLSTILKNNKIVFLGEQLHSDGSTFKAKARIIRYLHEKLGYNVLLYEASLYDMWLMNDQFFNKTLQTGIPDDKIQALGLHSFWFKNEENKKLWSYLRIERERNTPISFGGFDIQLTGQMSSEFRFNTLERYLDKKELHWDKYKSISKNKGDLFNYFYNHQDLRQSFKDSLLSELDSIRVLIGKNKKDYEDEIYIRYMNGLKERYQSIWEHSPGSRQSMQKRDSLMADNLIWLVDSIYKDQKMIVWAANVHTLFQNTVKDFQFKSLGEYIKDKYKSQSYMITFTSYGRKNEIGKLSNKASNKSIEYIFHNTNMPYLFMDISTLPQKSFFNKKRVSVINQALNIEANWSQSTDGIFYIDTISSVDLW